MKFFYVLINCFFFFGCYVSAETLRSVICLNGKWDFEKTDGCLPVDYSSSIVVPGLVDLASPSVDTIGTLYKNGWYWYKKNVKLPSTNYEKIILKLYKAKYHTKLFVNGQFVGENYYCFTPSYFDIKPFLNTDGRPNVFEIGVGCQSQLPDSIPNGYDFEKLKYIPGIYDNVEIILSNRPYIRNIQCIPNIESEKLRVVAELDISSAKKFPVSYAIKEVQSGNEVVKNRIYPLLERLEENLYKIDFEIPIKDAKLWSPESPFLYELSLSTGADTKVERFGMRSFRYDVDKQTVLLNGKPYYMRGTNVTILRFFEDPDRKQLPWNKEWVNTLHTQFKMMHWNSIRYCIGFPPEHWYNVCDSLGFLLQDEYPLWWSFSDLQPHVLPKHISEEYKRWMRERWNHPSVVIWDAQNESVTEKTAEAICSVRTLDLSNRPWENGWADPVAETDFCESHPYLFGAYANPDAKEPEIGYKKDFFGIVRRPHNDVNTHSSKVKESGILYKNPNLINEYGWIWLNRDGSTTSLTDWVYKNLFKGDSLSASQRMYVYIRNLAMLTEYWRAHRKAVGILHFCGLGYSRPEKPKGETSDNWDDITNLRLNPIFVKYMRPAFAPIGLMLDVWEKKYDAGTTCHIPLYIINDTSERVEKNMYLSILSSDKKTIVSYDQYVNVDPFDVKIVYFDIQMPSCSGNYFLKAYFNTCGEEIFSIRDLPVRD